jgi:hypothetical protein
VAREVHEREDLLRDATALSPRLQLGLNGDHAVKEIFAGFRAEGALSLYFNTAPVYHFNSRFELRRAFVDDRLIKAVQGKLVAMQPQRGPHSTDFVSHAMSPEEEQQFGCVLLEHLALLRTALQTDDYELIGQVPAEGNGLRRLTDWLAEFPGVKIADGPRVG